MRDLAWAFIGLLSGWRAFVLAQRDVIRLRASGETFGSGRATEFSWLSLMFACVSASLWWRTSLKFDHDITVLSVGLLIAVGLRLLLIDIDTHLLPSGIVYRATALALPLLFVAALIDPAGSVGGMLIGALIMWCVMKVLEVLSRGDLGGGDVTASLLLGLYLGWHSLESVVTALVISFASAGLFALLLLVLRRVGRRTHIAFGPFLIAGTLFTVLR
jgi:leader peptidase (prepilin peptidase)/N-methyltransferase